LEAAISEIQEWMEQTLQLHKPFHLHEVVTGEVILGYWWEIQKGKRPLGRSRCKWEDRIKMDIKEIVWSGMDWIDLAQDGDQWRALVNTVMNLRVP
jgi:hypothetical protein